MHVALNENILGLHIAMQNALFMAKAKSGKHLPPEGRITPIIVRFENQHHQAQIVRVFKSLIVSRDCAMANKILP